MKAKTLWVLIAIFAGVALCLPFLGGRGVRTRTVRTLQLRQNVYLDLDLLSESGIHDLVGVTAGVTDSTELNLKVVGFLKKCPDPQITNSLNLVASDGLFRDAWGMPLCFVLTNSTAYEKVEPQLKADKRTPFAIWSSGPNKTNDFGFGDDLSLHRQPVLR